MSVTDYNARLYEKMKAEQDKYRDWLLHQEPSEILNHTYEYTMREDIVMCMEDLELEPEKARALLRSPCPLSDVYKEFRDRETAYGRAFGKALLAVAAAPLLSGIVGLLGGTDGFALAAAAVLVIGTGIGVGCIAAVQKKYNGGMF